MFKKLCPGCTIANQKIGIATASLAASQTSSALLSHQNVDYVLPEYDALLQGVGQGIQQAGFTHKVKVAASAGDLPALEAIKAGTLSVDAGEDFPYIGWADADEAMRMMLAKPIVKELPPLRTVHHRQRGLAGPHSGGPGLRRLVRQQRVHGDVRAAVGAGMTMAVRFRSRPRAGRNDALPRWI